VWILVSRVFKCANKGCGIQILPSYLEALKNINSAELPKEEAYGTWKDEAKLDDEKRFSLEARIVSAPEYFERVLRVYMRWTNNGEGPQPHYLLESPRPWSGTLFTADRTGFACVHTRFSGHSVPSDLSTTTSKLFDSI